MSAEHLDAAVAEAWGDYAEPDRRRALALAARSERVVELVDRILIRNADHMTAAVPAWHGYDPQGERMQFEFTVTIEVERESGKFASRDEISEAIGDALGDAVDSIDLDGIGPDGESVYVVSDSNVEEIPQQPRRRSAATT